MKIKAYISEYKAPEQFANQGIPLNKKEYEEMVNEMFSNNVVQNEIHGMLNEYAMKTLLAVKAKNLVDADRCAGAMEALEILLKKKERKAEKVNVVK